MIPDADLIRRSHEGEKAARDELVKKNMGLVYMVAGRFKNRGHEMEELIIGIGFFIWHLKTR